MVPLAQMNATIALELLDDDLRAQRAVEAAQWMSPLYDQGVCDQVVGAFLSGTPPRRSDFP
jgi:hypothetical protein